MPSVNFFEEDISFKLKNKSGLKQWIKDTATAEGFKTGQLNYIFCSDSYLIEINRQYLNHDTYTDIVTFDNSEKEGVVNGDIFISVERVTENAAKFNAAFADELHRVIIHGVLHLLGYKDKSPADKKIMTLKEDYYLNKRAFNA